MAYRPEGHVAAWSEARCTILRENECVGPRQGNNATQLSKSVPMTGDTAEACNSGAVMATLVCNLYRRLCNLMSEGDPALTGQPDPSGDFVGPYLKSARIFSALELAMESD